MELRSDCHQWRLSDSVKVHQIRFWSDPIGGAYSVPPRPLAGLRGPTSEVEGKGTRGTGPHLANSWIRPRCWLIVVNKMKFFAS